jgi:hypothetical protein
MLPLISAATSIFIEMKGVWALYIAIFAVIRADPFMLDLVSHASESILFSSETRRLFGSNFLRRFLNIDTRIFGSAIFSWRAFAFSCAISVAITFFSVSLLFGAPNLYPLTFAAPFIAGDAHKLLIIAIPGVLSIFITDFVSLSKSRMLLLVVTRRPIHLLRTFSSESISVKPAGDGDERTFRSATTAVPIMILDLILTTFIFMVGFSILARVVLAASVCFFFGGVTYEYVFPPAFSLWSDYEFGLGYISGPHRYVTIWLYPERFHEPIVLFNFIAFWIWPAFFLSTFMTASLMMVLAMATIFVRTIVVQSKIVEQFVKSRVDNPVILFRDCAILTILLIVVRVFAHHPSETSNNSVSEWSSLSGQWLKESSCVCLQTGLLHDVENDTARRIR